MSVHDLFDARKAAAQIQSEVTALEMGPQILKSISEDDGINLQKAVARRSASMAGDIIATAATVRDLAHDIVDWAERNGAEAVSDCERIIAEQVEIKTTVGCVVGTTGAGTVYGPDEYEYEIVKPKDGVYIEVEGDPIPTAGRVRVFDEDERPVKGRIARAVNYRSIDSNFGREHADSFHRDLHPDLKADYVIANPPFNDSDWRGDQLKDDKRWVYGKPPAGNANFAWVQHFVYHLAPHGLAGFVLANGSMSSNQSGEGGIRKNIIEADLVDCMVALPGQLFYSTQIPVCLWFLARSKGNGRFRMRKGETLFMDARKLGTLIDRVHRELTDEDISQITDTYHAWRGDKSVKKKYEDVPGFCKSATLDEIRHHGHILTPGRYVGAAEVEDDGEPFEERMARLTEELKQQTAESKRLDKLIWSNLKEIGYG